MSKRCINTSMAVLMLICLTFGVLISDVSAKSVQPDEDPSSIIMSVNTCVAHVDFRIAGSGDALIEASVNAESKSNTDFTVCLQKKNANTSMWTTVKTWKKTSNKASTVFSTSYKLLSRGEYRCMLTGSVTKNGKTDTIYDTSKTVVY